MPQPDELKEFTPAELNRLQQRTGLTPYHLAQFLEAMRQNVRSKLYSPEYVYEESVEEPLPVVIEDGP